MGIIKTENVLERLIPFKVSSIVQTGTSPLTAMSRCHPDIQRQIVLLVNGAADDEGEDEVDTHCVYADDSHLLACLLHAHGRIDETS